MSQPSPTVAPPRAGATAGPARGAPLAPGAPAPSAPAGTTTTPPSARGLRGWAARSFEGTPGRMRLRGALAALAAALFGLASAANLWSVAAALDRAGMATNQVVRVQGIYSDMLRADADATNAFLVGGLEDSAQRADYEAAMGRVANAIAEAAKAEPADGTVLARLNATVQSYAGTIEQARAYNRQGLPIGAQYLRTASTTLRSEGLPLVAAVADANTERARGEFAGAGNGVLLVGVGLLSLAALGGVAVWLARRTHRYLNVPLTAGIAAVFVAFVVGVVVVFSVSRDMGTIRDNQFAGTLALTSARSAAYDAQSNESLGLIARGQAGTFEQSWAARDRQVRQELGELSGIQWYGGDGTSAGQLSQGWDAYAKAHAAVRARDDGGDWNGAVTAATNTAAGSARATFGAFDSAVARALDGYQEAMTRDVSGPRGGVVATGVLLLLAGLVSGWLALRGVNQRVEEYR